MRCATIKPELLRWARERIGRSIEAMSGQFKKLALWERGEVAPTLKQLEDFAKATYVPIGYLFLSEPPEERVPIPDLRTIRNQKVSHPSPDLLDTIYICQQRQAWYRDDARSVGQAPRRFVGSVDCQASTEQIAEQMRTAMGFDLDARRKCPTWTDALRRFIEQADDLGVLVMVSGVVGGNNRRKLNTEEFRGFALSDEYAPLIFINGADTKSAQMFTLAHELAHLWLGESALSDVSLVSRPSEQIEVWCNRVAAEFLVPLDVLRLEMSRASPPDVDGLARHFKVSTLVILLRLFDARKITWDTFHQAYQEEEERFQNISKGSGGNFYLTQTARISKRFARAVVTATWEGRASFTESFRLVGCKKMVTFREIGRTVGVDV